MLPVDLGIISLVYSIAEVTHYPPRVDIDSNTPNQMEEMI
jgi:hypothetical protein